MNYIDPDGKVAEAMAFNRGSNIEDALAAMSAVSTYYDAMPDGAYTETMKQFAYWLLYHPHGVIGEDVSDVLFELWLDHTE